MAAMVLPECGTAIASFWVSVQRLKSAVWDSDCVGLEGWQLILC